MKPIVRATTLDEETFKPIGVKTRYIFVQLASFKKDESECDKPDDQWIYNIKNMGMRQVVAFKQNSEAFKRLEEVANVATLTPQQRYDYEADLKMYRDTVNQIRGAYEEGEELGVEKGRAEGRAEEMTRSIGMMLSFGISAEQIAEKYGIPTEEVLRISNMN